MKLKYKIGLIGLLFCCSFTVTSCLDDFLEEEMYSKLTPGNFYRSEKNAIAAVSGIYWRMATNSESDNSFHRAALLMSEYPSECTDLLSSNVAYRTAFSRYSWRPDTDGIYFVWRFFYQVIYRANVAIKYIPGITNGNERNLKRLEAEARFVRALSYLYLVRLWENVPLITDPENNGDQFPTNMGTSDAVFNLIISDFKFAETYLEASYDAANVGRPTTGAAKTFLAKTYLTMAGYPYNKTEYYATAATKLEEIISSGTYSLLTNYADNFKEALEHNSEYIFDIEFHTEHNISNWHNMFGLRDQKFSAKYGGWSTIGGSVSFYQDMVNINGGLADKRFATNIQLGYTNVDDGQYKEWGVDYDRNKTWVHTWKYCDVNEPGVDNRSSLNYHFTRYADVLLMHSEAVNNAASFSGKYDKYYGINLVRDRAGLGPLSGLDKGAFNSSLIWERVVELCFEGHLWYDYKRLNCMEERVARRGIDIGTNKKYYVFPIPANDMAVNPNLEQHPLWKN